MTTSTATPTTSIQVVGARTHNLKGIDCAIPHGAVTVVTGPSGAGKSSLAFDTVYAEGQRRFVESMSTYAQQFIQQLERPPVDAIDNLQPAVALEARNSVRNARSTVGTLTEIQDLLRLVYTSLGEVACRHGHGPVRRWAPEEVADALIGGVAGDRFVLTASVPRPRQGADAALAELVRLGFFRVWIDGAAERLEAGAEWPTGCDRLDFVLGRFAADEGARLRITEAVESGYQLEGRAVVHAVAAGGDDEEELAPTHFGESLICGVCGEAAERPVAALFSFNSPLGACSTCSGFGRVIGIDRELVVPDRGLTLEERPIAPWNTPSYKKLYKRLFAACRARGVPLDVPWGELDAADRAWIWSGGRGFRGIEPFFAWLERRTYRVHVRVLLARYRAYSLCPDCRGARLQPDALLVTVAGRTLPELTAMSVERLRGWLAERRDEGYWPERQTAAAGHLLESLAERLEVMHRVGLDYLTLDRAARTLSGGETQRIHLAAALSSGLTGTLYVLDEPTVGLHPQDSRRLLGLLDDLASRGNTVLVVEHDPVIIEGADRVLELGPGAGEGGGELLFQGTPEALLDVEGSPTATYLRRRQPGLARRHLDRRRQEKGWRTVAAELDRRPRIEIRGATAHNLRDVDVELPLASLVAVTGVSGSGKSTLVESVLYDGWRAWSGEPGVSPGACREIAGLERLDEVSLLDQRPVGRSSRSNALTTIGAYDEVRKIYASTPEARERKLKAGHFSFNLKAGRCPHCEGTGEQEIDLQFMGSVTVSCEICQGRRFKPEVLSVRAYGRTLHETLQLTVDQAIEAFADHRGLCRKLRRLASVGLGYLRLGQPTSSLSAGEAQRLKIATLLRRKRKSTDSRLLLFDEPTTGLHLSDIAVLYKSLRQLVEKGDGVIVVEHQLDLIARADWIVELGPGGGAHGGRLLYSGPLQGFLDGVDSPTATELRRHLEWDRRTRYATASG